MGCRIKQLVHPAGLPYVDAKALSKCQRPHAGLGLSVNAIIATHMIRAQGRIPCDVIGELVEYFRRRSLIGCPRQHAM